MNATPWAGIGARIRQARLEAGFSQEAFAAEIGTSRRHMIRLERGDHRPSKPMLRRIAEASGREATWIDPDADEEDRQAAVALVELLRLHVRELVRIEVERTLAGREGESDRTISPQTAASSAGM
jgi:transcriptional regulator with XRE-family HTH domain